MTTADQQGRTFYVTGGNSGLGRATVDALIARGGSVILASRSEEKTRPVIEDIRRRNPGADLSFALLDLADLASVRRAATAYLASGRPLDVLINNAGVAGARGLTKDGFDITIGTNHIGPFLLTALLLPRLREAKQGRIVNVSSGAHRSVRRVDWDMLNRPPASMSPTKPTRSGAASSSPPKRSSMAAYGLSKLMNILHAKELARRLADTPVTTYSLHPGAVASDIWRELPGPVQFIMKRFMLTNEEGAKTQIYCATAPELSAVSGRYYERSRENRPSKLAQDDALAREMFVRSEAAIA